MLEKPDIPDELLVSHVHQIYGLQPVQLRFLPLGADLNTVVYRLTTDSAGDYFLKLRKSFNAITVNIPLALKAQGVQEIIAPIPAASGQHWAEFGEYTMIMYPFIEGQNGFDVELRASHRRTFGAALRRIHTAELPADIGNALPQETYSPEWRERVKSIQALVEAQTFHEPTAAKLAAFMKDRSDQIRQLIARTDMLASELQSMTLEPVLCHTDVHGGNILIGSENELYIVDWDDPLLAPKERDLMFIGGGIDPIWKTDRDIAVFYEGYGDTNINLSALAYFRFERVIQDLAVSGERLLMTDEGGADREREFGWFTSNFEPGNTIEIAEHTSSLGF